MMGLNILEEYGGFGASASVFTRVFGEPGGTDTALTVYFGAHESIDCKGITLFGTDEQSASGFRDAPAVKSGKPSRRELARNFLRTRSSVSIVLSHQHDQPFNYGGITEYWRPYAHTLVTE